MIAGLFLLLSVLLLAFPLGLPFRLFLSEFRVKFLLKDAEKLVRQSLDLLTCDDLPEVSLVAQAACHSPSQNQEATVQI